MHLAQSQPTQNWIELDWIELTQLSCSEPEKSFPTQGKQTQSSGFNSELVEPPYWNGPQDFWEKTSKTPHSKITISLNSCPLVGATEHGTPKQPDAVFIFPTDNGWI